MLSVALFSHSRYLCGAERMPLNLALLLERSRTIRPILLVPGEGELLSETRRHGLACQIVPEPPWYLLQPNTLPHMNVYCRGVTTCTEALQADPGRSQQRRHSGQYDDQRARHAGGGGLEHPQPVVGPRRDRLVALALQDHRNSPPGMTNCCCTAPRGCWPWRTTRATLRRVMQRCAGGRGSQLDAGRSAIQSAAGQVPLAAIRLFEHLRSAQGLHYAAAAADLLRARNLYFELHLYGDGGLRGEMEKWAPALGLQDYVRFQGRTTNVQEVYDRSLAIVNPAQVEPFGMTLIEAMARKTPVVATRSGGPDDIIVDGQSGYLVDRGDAAAVADRMQALLESPELAQRLGEEGFQRACSCYSEEAAQAAFLPLIEDAVRDFHGYEPVVKTLAKIYRLWLDQAVARPARCDLPRSRWQVPCGRRPGWPGEAFAVPKALGKTASWRCSDSTPRHAPARSPLRGSRTCSPDRSMPRRRWILPAGRENSTRCGGRPAIASFPTKATGPDLTCWSAVIPLLAAGQLRLCVRSASGQVLRETAISLGDLWRKRLARLPLLAYRQCRRHALRRGIRCGKPVSDRRHGNLRKRHPGNGAPGNRRSLLHGARARTAPAKKGTVLQDMAHMKNSARAKQPAFVDRAPPPRPKQAADMKGPRIFTGPDDQFVTEARHVQTIELQVPQDESKVRPMVMVRDDEAQFRAMLLARDIDAIRQRRTFRVLSRLLERFDLRNTLPPNYRQLLDDSMIFLPDLRGFCLQQSVNLQRVGGLGYPLVLPPPTSRSTGCPGRPELRGLLLAPRFDIRPTQGSLRVEIHLPTGETAVRRHSRPRSSSARFPCGWSFAVGGPRQALPPGNLRHRRGRAALRSGVAQVSLLGSGTHGHPGILRYCSAAPESP